MTTIPKRRGARHPALVPREVVDELESGGESANHMEQIAMDMGNLFAFEFPRLGGQAERLRCLGLVAAMRVGGRLLYEGLGLEEALSRQSGSDTVRGWLAMTIGYAPDLSLDQRLELLRPFADDSHFAVREWAWLSLRPRIGEDVPGALVALQSWTAEPSAKLRRFASEVTRPRGVWSPHLPVLKSRPSLGLPLIDSLKADSARYVQDSVGNWLNDAGRSHPSWVRKICSQWLKGADAEATERICRRASRNLPEKAGSG